MAWMASIKNMANRWGGAAHSDQIYAGLLILSGFFVTLVAALNATLIFDDPFLYEHFATQLSTHGFFHTLRLILFNFDLYEGVPEYRTYGISKVLHFLLWLVFDNRAWLYSTVVGVMQGVTACLIYQVLRRMGVERFQRFLIGFVWVFSPFQVTTCFHHYSYLILPVQLTIFLAYYLQGRVLQNLSLTRWCVAGLFGVGGILALTGELHLVLSAVVLIATLYFTPSALSYKMRFAYLIPVAIALPLTLVVHRSIWNAYSPQVDVHRFNYSPPGFVGFFARSLEFFSCVYPGAEIQARHVLSFSAAAMFIFLLMMALCGSFLWFMSKKDVGSCSVGPVKRRPKKAYAARWCLVLCALFLASLAIVWVRAVFFSKVGEVLPRRYGYIPYTIFFAALIAGLASRRVRALLGNLPAVLVSAAVFSTWAALQLACLPEVRKQDSLVWDQLRDAMKEKRTPHILFVGGPNRPRPAGFDSPGLRGANFPPIFESPFMRNGWQVAYARVVLGAVGGGDIFQFKQDGYVSLSGSLSGIHFVPAAPVTVPADSLLVVMDEGYETLGWRDGLGRIKVLRSWHDFMNTAGFLKVRTQVGWKGLLTGIFNESSREVAIDLGQRGRGLGPGMLADKLYQEPFGDSQTVANYGLESGDAGVYSPNEQSGIPLSYLTTNRHGSFTYRIDFKDVGPKLVSIDFLDWWAAKPKDRIMRIQVELDNRWIDLGHFDTYAIGNGEPVAIRFYVSGVGTIRIRLTQNPLSRDIPFANGIRIKKVSETEI